MLTESHDMTPKHAKQVLDHTWRDTPENMKIKLTADLPKLFSRLKSQGVKVSNFETMGVKLRHELSKGIRIKSICCIQKILKFLCPVG